MSKYPFKRDNMSDEDYARQRALNETMRYLLKNESITLDRFWDILLQFELAIVEAETTTKEKVFFIRQFTDSVNLFSRKPSTPTKDIIKLVNQLDDKAPKE